MKPRIIGAIAFAAISTPAFAAPISVDVTATVSSGDVAGSYSGIFSAGDVITGTFVYDTDEANASSAQTTPSTVPGHEFSSFYDFAGAAYTVSINATGFSFNSTAPVAVVVNDDLPLTAGDTNGIISDGTYDWIEIVGGTTSPFCPLAVCTQQGEYIPVNGQEWTLAFIASDANWFSDGSLIPDSLPATYTPILVGLDIDASGNEIGAVVVTLDSLNISAVPVPAAVWLFGSGLLGLVGIAKRKKEA
jgi:hypothetical protein